MQTLMNFYVVAGLLLMILSLPLIAGKVKPNPIYGFRVRATLDNPQKWVSTNRYFAKRQFFVGLAVIAAALGLYLIPKISLDAYALSVLGVFTAAFGFALYQSLRYMRSLD